MASGCHSKFLPWRHYQSNTEPEFNVEAEKAVFTAAGDVGSPDAPIIMKTTYLEGTAEGSVYIENKGALTVGDATAAKNGMIAGGEIVLTTKACEIHRQMVPEMILL
jgi:hypothetical protein